MQDIFQGCICHLLHQVAIQIVSTNEGLKLQANRNETQDNLMF